MYPPSYTPAALPYVLVSQVKSSHTVKVSFEPDANADALKDAIMSKFKLEVADSRLRLLHVVDGANEPVPLDSLKKLEEQGVGEGSRVVAEVMRE